MPFAIQRNASVAAAAAAAATAAAAAAAAAAEMGLAFPLAVFSDVEDNKSLLAMLIGQGLQTNLKLTEAARAGAPHSEGEKNAAVTTMADILDKPTLSPVDASLLLVTACGFRAVVDPTDATAVKLLSDSPAIWGAEQAAVIVQSLLELYDSDKGEALDAVYRTLATRIPMVRLALIVLLAKNWRTTPIDGDAKTAIDTLDAKRLEVFSMYKSFGVLVDHSSPDADMHQTCQQLLTGGIVNRGKYMISCTAAVKAYAEAGYTPGAHPDFKNLAVPVQNSLLARAGLPSGPSAASGLGMLGSAGHPSVPSGQTALNTSAAGIFAAAQGHMGSGQSSTDTIFQGHAPGAAAQASFNPNVPLPIRHIPPEDPANIASCAKTGDFTRDPTPQERQAKHAQSDMVLQANGSWRAYSSTKAAAMPVDVAQLLLGGHRLGHWSVAEGRWSPAVRLAHDKHIHHIVSLVRSGAYTWATACAVENDFREKVHCNEITSFADRTALANMFVFAATKATPVKQPADESAKAQATRDKRKRQREAAKAKKAAKAAEGGGKSTGRKDFLKLRKPLKDTNGDTLCFDFQIGKCTRTACSFVHGCGVCGDSSDGHAGKDCPDN